MGFLWALWSYQQLSGLTSKAVLNTTLHYSATTVVSLNNLSPAGAEAGKPSR